MAAIFTTLKTKFPCCGGPARVSAVSFVPREQYERTCSHCGQRWAVERRTVKESEKGRIDILEWERR